MTPLELAMLFHEAYERLAPSFGYGTREDTRIFLPESQNGGLMVAVCEEVLKVIRKQFNGCGFPGITFAEARRLALKTMRRVERGRAKGG